ncbi:MAG TPA: peptidyl-tRNA hydrolase [Polyangia bacterium]
MPTDDQWLKDWEIGGAVGKMALPVADLPTLEALKTKLAEGRVIYSWIVDAGRTEIEPGTPTCMAMQPMLRSIAAKYVGSIGLLR